jgi:hypothetical protein
VQLSFAPGDVGEVREGENINIIRDAVVFYRPNKRWNFSFGQTKLPGNRQRVNSSGGLQLTDRTINNAKFTIDRDFGFQLHQLNEFPNKFSYNFKTAVSTGEGRNITEKADDGVAVTGKVELFPFGAFSKDGTYFEGDIVREAKPKMMLSGAFQQNNHARRTQGQLGDNLLKKERSSQSCSMRCSSTRAGRDEQLYVAYVKPVRGYGEPGRRYTDQLRLCWRRVRLPVELQFQVEL